MLKFYYLIQSKKNEAPIYIRIKDGNIFDVKRKTREFINPDYWNNGKGMPINRKSLSKEDALIQDDLFKRLDDLKTFIIKQYRDRKDGDILEKKEGEWLAMMIDAYYNGGRIIDRLDYLKDYLEYYKRVSLPTRKHKGRKVSEATKKRQKTIIGHLLQWIDQENPKMKVSDYGLESANEFETYLRNLNRLSENTIGRYVKYTKTIVGSAKHKNIELHDTITEIKGFTEETPTLVLKTDEIERIRNLKVLSEHLQISRDWLLIGLHTGQRASDLFRMNSKMIIEIEGESYLNLIQKKTSTGVQIPLHDEVKEILAKYNGEFPPTYSDNMESNKTVFNRAIKRIAYLAELDREAEGKVYDSKLKRYVHGMYPIYKIISSHICRRTFATMYYSKVPNQIIMSVTGHKTEKVFLNYIGVDESELSKQMFVYWKKMKEEKKEISKKRFNYKVVN